MKSIIVLIFLLPMSHILIAQNSSYPKIKNNTAAFYGDNGQWDEGTVHTLSIVEVNQKGYKYWGYYGLDYYNKDGKQRKGGIAMSNDLMNWEKYDGNPILEDNCRWPTLVYHNNLFSLFYAEYDEKNNSRIVLVESDNGIDFSGMKEIVSYKKGEQNQNPFIYHNPQDGMFYLYYYKGTERSSTNKEWMIYVKKSDSIHGLVNAKEKFIMGSPETLAAPSVAYYNDTYYMLVEEFDKQEDKWVTNALYSKFPDKDFQRVDNNPILDNNDACAFQYIFDGTLYATYSHCLDLAAGLWNLRIITLE